MRSIYYKIVHIFLSLQSVCRYYDYDILCSSSVPDLRVGGDVGAEIFTGVKLGACKIFFTKGVVVVTMAEESKTPYSKNCSLASEDIILIQGLILQMGQPPISIITKIVMFTSHRWRATPHALVLAPVPHPAAVRVGTHVTPDRCEHIFVF